MQGQLATHLRLIFAAFVLLALSGCGSLDFITARNAMGDKDRFQWDSPRAVRYEAIRLGVISESDEFKMSDWEQALQKLAENWFPIGSPVEDLQSYFEANKFSFEISYQGDFGFPSHLVTSEKEAIFYARHETAFPLLGKNVQTVIFVFDADDPQKKIKRVKAGAKGYRGL